MNEGQQVVLTTEALEAAISNYEARKAAMENTYLKISNEVLALDGVWKGKASEQFKASYRELYKNISDTDTVMSNIIKHLKESLSEYQGASERSKSAAENLDVGTSFTYMT